jgi:hypothetical protein
MANITVPSRHLPIVEQAIREWFEQQPRDLVTDGAISRQMADGRYRFFGVPDTVLPHLRERGVPFVVDSR